MRGGRPSRNFKFALDKQAHVYARARAANAGGQKWVKRRGDKALRDSDRVAGISLFTNSQARRGELDLCKIHFEGRKGCCGL